MNGFRIFRKYFLYVIFIFCFLLPKQTEPIRLRIFSDDTLYGMGMLLSIVLMPMTLEKESPYLGYFMGVCAVYFTKNFTRIFEERVGIRPRDQE